MSNESLASWKTDTSILVLQELPLQTLTTAGVLVEDYLSSTGGWVPEDVGDPTGPGQPASGETAPEAAKTIAESQIERVYNNKITADLKVDFHIAQNLDPTLSDEDVLTLIQETIVDFLQNQLGCTTVAFNEFSGSTGVVGRSGYTTADERVTAHQQIESGEKLIDPVAIGLQIARDRFELDDFWNVTYIYTEQDQDIVVQVERYTDTNYTTLDPFTLTQQIVKIDATTYKLASGVSKTRSED